MWATTAGTELMLRQVCGRALRTRVGLPVLPALVHMPADPRLKRFAARIAAIHGGKPQGHPRDTVAPARMSGARGISNAKAVEARPSTVGPGRCRRSRGRDVVGAWRQHDDHHEAERQELSAMSLTARREYQRVERAAIDELEPEHAAALEDEWPCEGCGCSHSLACEEGCGWARPGLCTACANDGVVLLALDADMRRWLATAVAQLDEDLRAAWELALADAVLGGVETKASESATAPSTS